MGRISRLITEIEILENDDAPLYKRINAISVLAKQYPNPQFWNQQTFYLVYHSTISHELHMYLTVLKEKLKQSLVELNKVLNNA